MKELRCTRDGPHVKLKRTKKLQIVIFGGSKPAPKIPGMADDFLKRIKEGNMGMGVVKEAKIH